MLIGNRPIENLEKFNDRVFMCPMSGCWLWGGRIMAFGYGRFKIDGHRGKDYLAHRFSYEMHRGGIPEGLQIDHLCKNTSCVNPWHMEAVTPKENGRRSGNWAGTNWAKTHCPRGHEYTEENTYTYTHSRGKGFSRSCRECALARSRDFKRHARLS